MPSFSQKVGNMRKLSSVGRTWTHIRELYANALNVGYIFVQIPKKETARPSKICWVPRPSLSRFRTELDYYILCRSMTVFVIVSGSDGRKRYQSHRNNSKATRARPYVLWGANRNPWTGYRTTLSPTHHVSPNPQIGGRKVFLSNCSQAVGERRKCY